RRDQLDRLSRDVDEPVAHEPEIVRPVELLEDAQWPGHGIGAWRQLLGEVGRHRRKEMPLDPADSLESLQKRLEKMADRVDHVLGGRHGEQHLTAASEW